MEYTASGGIVEDGKGSIFSRVNANYGLSKFMTIGAGVEYLSTLESKTTMPFASVTARPLSNLILSEDYMYGVRSKTIFNYQFPKNIQLELNYINRQMWSLGVNRSGFQKVVLYQINTMRSKLLKDGWKFQMAIGLSRE